MNDIDIKLDRRGFLASIAALPMLPSLAAIDNWISVNDHLPSLSESHFIKCTKGTLCEFLKSRSKPLLLRVSYDPRLIDGYLLHDLDGAIVFVTDPLYEVPKVTHWAFDLSAQLQQCRQNLTPESTYRREVGGASFLCSSRLT